MSLLLFFFFAIGLFFKYLFINIQEPDGSHGLFLLALFIIMQTTIMGVLCMGKTLKVRLSFLFLLFFWSYLALKIVVQSSDLELLKQWLFALTSGNFTFYALASSIGFNIKYIFELLLKERKLVPLFSAGLIFLSVMVLLELLKTYYIFLPNIRSDIFLLNHDANYSYQRRGNFLNILFIVYLFLVVVHYILKIKWREKWSLPWFFVCLFLVNSAIAIFVSQVFGSNKTVLCLALYVVVLLILPGLSKIRSTLNGRLKLISFFSFGILSRLFFITFLFLLLLIIYLYIGKDELQEILNKFRIFNYGNHDGFVNSSVSNRIKLWDNFIDHFDINPLFGNVIVDKLTTGKGTYVHSFVLSMLTHTGLVGFLLFLLYVFSAVKERMRLSQIAILENNIYTVFVMMVFLGLLVFAFLGVFVSWMPIWFLMGLIFPCLVLSSKNPLYI